MICTCKICGKKFEGRANGCICSGICRDQAKRDYAKKYRMSYPDRVKQNYKRCYENRKPNITSSDNIAFDIAAAAPKQKPKQNPMPKPRNHKKIATDSNWAKVYAAADRLTKIAMLSSELSRLEIEHISYGQLSLIWLTQRYYSLLQQVLDIKAAKEPIIAEEGEDMKATHRSLTLDALLGEQVKITFTDGKVAFGALLYNEKCVAPKYLTRHMYYLIQESGIYYGFRKSNVKKIEKVDQEGLKL